MERFAEVFEQDGRQFLFYVEPDGDDYKLHQIGQCDFGQVDLVVTLEGFPDSIDTPEKMFAEITREIPISAMAVNLIKTVAALQREVSQ